MELRTSPATRGCCRWIGPKRAVSSNWSIATNACPEVMLSLGNSRPTGRLPYGRKVTKSGDEHDDVAGREAPVQNHPTAVAQHQGLAEVAQGALQEQVAVAEARAFQIIAVSLLGSRLEAVSLAGFGARQLRSEERRVGK